MNPFIFNYNVADESSTFTKDRSNTSANITDAIKAGEDKFTKVKEELIPVTGTSLPAPSSSEVFDIPSQQEGLFSDTDSSNIDVDEILYKIRMNNKDFHTPNDQNANYYFGNGSQAEPLSSQIRSDNSSNGNKSVEVTDTLDFLIKSISSANNYVSMLTCEQLAVLRSIRPSLLYDFLQEITRVRSNRRMRRALPHECAFCKNNGENEECYSSHALKDFRGRVLCPVLRAFCCPRCGATGDRAHTIKYCPETFETGSDRFGSLGYRRRSYPPSTLLVGAAAANRSSYGSIAPTTPASSPTSSYSQSCWATFALNSSL